MYFTGTDNRWSIRWYNSEKRIVKKHVRQDVDVYLTLSPVGAGPTVRLTQHDNFLNEYPVPGDVSTETLVEHGNELTLSAPGFGVIAHIAGQDPIDGEHRGILRDIFDPAVIPVLCQALTP